MGFICGKDKELIDKHTEEIDFLKGRFTAPGNTIVESKNVDMDELMKVFASKNPPDNTINRIEDLENMMQDLNNRFANLGEPATVTNTVSSGLDADAMDKLKDLLRRVQSLETRADKSDKRMDQSDNTLADHERRIKALEAMDLSGTEVNATGEIDTASILKQVNLIKAEVSSMRLDFNNYQTKVASDLDALRHEMRGYTDK